MKLIITEEQIKKIIVEFTTREDALSYFYEQLNELSKEIEEMKTNEGIHVKVYRHIVEILMDIATDYYMLDKGLEMDVVRKVINHTLMTKQPDNRMSLRYIPRAFDILNYKFGVLMEPTSKKDYNLFYVSDYKDVTKSLGAFFFVVDYTLDELKTSKKKKKEEEEIKTYDYSEFPAGKENYEEGSIEEKIYKLNRLLYNLEKLMKDEYLRGDYDIKMIDIEDGIEKVKKYFDATDYRDSILLPTLDKIVKQKIKLSPEFIELMDLVLPTAYKK